MVSFKFVSLSGELENWLSVSRCTGFEKLTAMKAYSRLRAGYRNDRMWEIKPIYFKGLERGNESAVDLFVFFASFGSVVPQSNGRTQAGNIAEIHDFLLQSAQPFLCGLHS